MKPEALIGEEGCKFVAKELKSKTSHYPIGVMWEWRGEKVLLSIYADEVYFFQSKIGFSHKEFDRFLEPKSDPRFNADGFPVYAPTRERLQRYVNELYEHAKDNKSKFYDVSYNVVCSFNARNNAAFIFKGGAENSLSFAYTIKEIQACLEGRVTKQVKPPAKSVEYPLIFTEKELNDF